MRGRMRWDVVMDALEVAEKLVCFVLVAVLVCVVFVVRILAKAVVQTPVLVVVLVAKVIVEENAMEHVEETVAILRFINYILMK